MDPAGLFLQSFARMPKPNYDIHVSAKLVGSTLWIHAATEKELLTYSGNIGQGDDPQGKPYLQINGEYVSNGFSFHYSPFKVPPLPEVNSEEEPDFTGVGPDFTNAAQEISMIIYAAIADLLYRKPENLDFVVICLTDIVKGISIKTIAHRSDLEKYLSQAIPPDEFHSRSLIKTKGSSKMIGDKNGKCLDPRAIKLEDFIVELVKRQSQTEMMKLKEADINSDVMRDLVLKNFFNLTKTYDFNDYLTVELEEMPSGKPVLFSKHEIQKKFGPPDSK